LSLISGSIHIDASTSYGLFINSDAIKNCTKIVKYLEFLAKVYSNIAGNVRNFYQIMSYVYYVAVLHK